MSGAESELHILLIEDDRLDAELIEEMLDRQLRRPFALRRTGRLAEGMKFVGSDHSVDVVLVALALPDSFGLKTFQKVHDATDLPIIVISSVGEEEAAIVAVREGADDYLVKGDFSAESLCRSIRFSLERAEHRRVERELARANEQIRIAERIQQYLLPDVEMTFPGFDIAGAVFPAERASGDYCDFIPMPDGGLGVVVADVSGHGLGASHLMLQARAAIRALASLNVSVGEILTRMNDLFLQDCHATAHFLTMFFTRLDPHHEKCEFAAAGHSGYLFKPNGELLQLNSTGPAVGLLEGRPIPAETMPRLEPGSILVLPTDGIIESLSSEYEMFGKERMRQTIHDNRDQPAHEIVQALYSEAREFSKSEMQQDDMTAVVVKVLN